MYVLELVAKYSYKYDVPAQSILDVINCETGRDYSPDVQSKAFYKMDRPDWGVKKGQREKSFGWAQIHLPAHPEISYGQMTDPDFATEFIAKEIAKGNGKKHWAVCYKS